MKPIDKVAVIGAGVMGSGIAAQVANAGVDVLLLDIVPDDAADRNMLAKRAIDRLRKTEPAPLMHERAIRHIIPGNTEDDLQKLADCAWIIEAVLEDLEIKQSLYRKLESHRKSGSIVSSNTSTLPLAILTAGLSEGFCRDFLISHFFNPPRYMRLLEVVSGEKTDPQVLAGVASFADLRLGKSVVYCHDTPGFIANRIGAYWLQLAVTEAVRQGIGVEVADLLIGRAAGIPKTGVFSLIDLIGLDLLPHIFKNLQQYIGRDDPFHQLAPTPELIDRMIADGYTGRKGKGGFYRLNEKRQKEVISLIDGSYAAVKRPKPAVWKAVKKRDLRAVLSHDSAEGRYAWTVFSGTLAYAAGLVPEIADDIESVDRAMRLGYNWKYGPFELLDRIGGAWFTRRLRQEGRPVPKLLADLHDATFYRSRNGSRQFRDLTAAYRKIPRPDGVLLLGDVKSRGKALLKNRSASVWDLGDYVACLEFHSKMNSLNLFTLAMMERTVRELPKRGFKALVIHNEGQNFSVGANIVMLLVALRLRLWPAVDWLLQKGQRALDGLKYAPFPVIGAPSGMALGGGCEILLHCDAVVAHAETYIGLVEVGVGIVPGWGGCKELLGRWATSTQNEKGPMPATIKAFEIIAQARVAKSAALAKDMLFLKKNDRIIMNRDRVLAAAKAQALELANGYEPPEPFQYRLAGPSGQAALLMGIHDFVKKGIASKHDATIGKELARVLSGGATDHTETLVEDDILRLERQALLTLLKTPKTRARIEHMLKTGKPLRN